MTVTVGCFACLLACLSVGTNISILGICRFVRFRLALLKNQILIFGDFWLGKIRKSEKNQNKNQLTNTSINLGVMGMSTLVLHSAYGIRNTYVSVRICTYCT